MDLDPILANLRNLAARLRAEAALVDWVVERLQPQLTMAEEPPGETVSITMGAGLAVDFTWTPTGIICTVHGILPLPQQDLAPPGAADTD